MAEPKEIYDKVMTKLKTLFEGVVSKEEMDLLKEFLKPVVTPVKLAELKTKDGKTLSIEGELAEGAVIKEAGAEGLIDLADGDYVVMVEDKEVTVSVAGGKVAKITAAAAPPPADMAAVTAALAKLSTQLSSNAIETAKAHNALVAENTNFKKQFTALAAIVDKMANAPVNLAATEKTDKELENMTPYEKAVYERESRKK